MIRPKLLMSAQQTVVQAFVGEGVAVRFDAIIPYADLEKRIIHLRPMPEAVSRMEMQDIRADCDHEIAHFIYTDPTALAMIDRKMVELITNAIEDGFIERMHGGKYFGCGENLDASNGRHLAEMKKSASSAVTNRRARALTGLMLLSRGVNTDGVYEALGSDFSDYYDEIEDLLPQISTVASTADSAALGEEIADRWRWDTPDGRKDSRVRALAPMDGKGDGTDDDDVDETAPTNPAAQSSDIDIEGEEKEASKLEKLGLSTARKMRISKMEFKRSRVYRAKTDNDVVQGVPEPNPLAYRTNEIFPIFMSEVRQIAAPLRRRLLMEFRGPGASPSRHQRRGKIDERSLHKAVLGDPNIFVADTKDIVIDSDITLMVDCSGSMLCRGEYWPGDLLDLRRGSRLWQAAQAACACSLVLDLIGVPHEVLGWTTAGSAKKDQNYERVIPLRHIVVKPSNGSFHRYQKNFTRLALLDNPAENIDGEALLWGAMRLAGRARRAGRRPVLIVFSDGVPQSSPEDPSVLAWHLKETVERIEAAGVKTIGVGIQTSAVKRFYPNWVVVRKLSDLVERFYTLLREQLRGNRKVRN